MPDPSTPSAGASHRPRTALPWPQVLAFSLAAAAVIAVGAMNFRMHQTRAEAADALTHALEVIEQSQAIVSSLKDAETGQRGYLLTGIESYLDPYVSARNALPSQFNGARRLLERDPRQLDRLGTLQRLSSEKMVELEETIALRRAGRTDEALNLVRSDRGKGLMDRVRQAAAGIEREERLQATLQREEWGDAVAASVAVTWAGSLVLLVLIGAAGIMMSRDHRRREEETWVRTGQVGLSARLQGDLRVDQLAERALDFLASQLDARVGAFYAAEPAGTFRRIAGYALPPGAESGTEAPLLPGQGLLGEAARGQRSLHVRELPEDYLTISSSLGQARPRELLLLPASVDGRLQCVVELGFFRRLEAVDAELLDRVAGQLAVAMRSARDRSRLEELLEETQRQSEELQMQQEELRVSNEELEEQGRVLKDSQARLENQAAELEQTNLQLEEQTRTLETQRDELERAQGDLAERAAELERASQYKSQFLANMSHELRTPLNSTLILAKLLADNKEGTLTPEQVKFAQTIRSAGNDLLNLINDILDLSKIEAGRMEVDLQRVPLRALLAGLQQAMEPTAVSRGLRLELEIADGVPDGIVTDEQRIGQVLKNLLSNALKFTERGEVRLRATSDAARRQVRLAVSDTGIGIAPSQQQAVFEAFTQADGSTHRKYGGTGLGLAISRELAHLLGGEIELDSAVGQGSTFTLVLPWEHAAAAAAAPPARTAPPAFAPGRVAAQLPAATVRVVQPPTAPQQVEDDRQHIVPGARVLLVIEDDVHFAAILRDLVREAGFRCVVTHSAADGLAAVRAHRPDGILLDVNLPDHSGLGVLDQLKHDPQTRHIPVHIVSVADHAQDAFEMGAVGYAVKPVDREQLVHALQLIDAKLTQTLRRVLVVEDDARQRDSIHQLLAADGVEIVGVEDAAAALRALQGQTFDCMVMDLSLPDMSGYELLERMAEEDGLAFPPVIVYTGRSLTGEQEQQLRRFSKSIIIKGARSPERLLAEVTLFLHQVETQLPPERQRMLREARNHEQALEGRRVLVVEDDVRNIFALSAVLEPKGMAVQIARNGREALEALDRSTQAGAPAIDLVLMDIMMPEMDGYTAMREIRRQPRWQKLPIIALTAKAMADDQEKCLAAGANDYIAKPLDVEKLLSLVRVWMRK